MRLHGAPFVIGDGSILVYSRRNKDLSRFQLVFLPHGYNYRESSKNVCNVELSFRLDKVYSHYHRWVILFTDQTQTLGLGIQFICQLKLVKNSFRAEIRINSKREKILDFGESGLLVQHYSQNLNVLVLREINVFN